MASVIEVAFILFPLGVAGPRGAGVTSADALQLDHASINIVVLKVDYTEIEGLQQRPFKFLDLFSETLLLLKNLCELPLSLCEAALKCHGPSMVLA